MDTNKVNEGEKNMQDLQVKIDILENTLKKHMLDNNLFMGFAMECFMMIKVELDASSPTKKLDDENVDVDDVGLSKRTQSTKRKKI